MLSKRSIFGSALAIGALVLTGCGVSNSGSGDGTAGGDSAVNDDWANCTPAAESADLGGMETDGEKDITLGAFNGWDESFVSTHLMKYVLEEEGYTVNIEAFDAGPGYEALRQGDVDMMLDTWLPLTHADYIAELGDDVEAAGCWYDNAKLTIAVNEDSPAQTIGDLAEMGDDYGNTLYGIEPGAGLTKTTEEQAIPTYGLEGLNFQISSTPAMLSQVKRATDSGENVAVTLWRPHWAYAAFPMRDLEDPGGAMGDAEIIYNFATAGFGESHPYATQLAKNLAIDDETLSDIENVMFSDENYGGENLEQAVAEWAGNNQEFIDNWKAGALGQ